MMVSLVRVLSAQSCSCSSTVKSLGTGVYSCSWVTVYGNLPWSWTFLTAPPSSSCIQSRILNPSVVVPVYSQPMITSLM